MRVLGLSGYYHDSAAALVRDGEIAAAAQEERFTRVKHDAGFPSNAVAYCLDEEGVRLDDIDWVVFYDKPFLKFERLMETYLALAPLGLRSFSMAAPLWLREKLFLKDLLLKRLRPLAGSGGLEGKLLFSEHHLSHAASAFFPSPFREAAVLTADGVGEWATTSCAVGRESRLEILREIHFPHSLGLLYSAFTYQAGFKVNSGEYKLMGLAPYGEPRFAGRILEELIDLKPDGSFRLNLEYFNFPTGLTMTGKAFDRLFGGPPRKPDEPIEQRHKDMAASVQAVLEEALLRMCRALRSASGMRNLCLAGGVALNAVANGRLLRERVFDGIWIQPASGDAGGALGAALAAYHLYAGRDRTADGLHDGMKGAYLGPAYSPAEIGRRLAACGARWESLAEGDLLARTADALARGAVVGWFQGRMEFGPRALGSRSILADPRLPGMQEVLNEKVKRRERFRPFAPAVAGERAREWFALDGGSPYMLQVARVKLQGIPAVTHVDGSARIQTVDRETNPLFHALLGCFEARTGCPVLVNTSFNVRGEPIVCTPEEAFRCFMATGLDALAAGGCWLVKENQDPGLARDYSYAFEPD